MAVSVAESASVVDRFASEYFTLNSITESRQEQVLAALARFQEYMGERPLHEATDADLRGWLVELLNDGLKPSTVDLRLRTVKPFFRWCWLSRIIDADDFLRLRAVPPPRGARGALPRPYSRKDLARLWQALDATYPRLVIDRYRPDGRNRLARWRNGTSPWRSVRRHFMRVQVEAIIELALVCGLRRVEIYRLSIADVHFDNKYIVVHGKRVDQNDKVRDVPYPDSARKAVREWLRLRADLSPETTSIWLSVTGHDPAEALTEDRLATVLQPLGGFALHRLRHTCATERLRAGMKLEELQKFLGHANIQQTLAYADLVREDIHRSSERVDEAFQRAIRPRAA